MRPVKSRLEPLRGACLALTFATALGAAACSGQIECKTEVTNGADSYVGKAVGKAETEELRRESVRDACRQKCAAEQAPMIDPCSARCGADIAAQKLGGRTTCGKK